MGKAAVRTMLFQVVGFSDEQAERWRRYCRDTQRLANVFYKYWEAFHVLDGTDAKIMKHIKDVKLSLIHI